MSAVFEREGLQVAPPPWRRMTFAEAVGRYGSDRPDTRYGLELVDIGDPLRSTQFQVFARVLEEGGVVRGINAGRRELARSELDELTKLARQHGAAGLVWAFAQDGGWRSPVAKFLSQAEIGAVNELLAADEGDLLLIVSGDPITTGKSLGALRTELAERFELIPPDTHEILWVVQFPMFMWDDEEQRWDAEHHPFTAPTGDLDDPGSLLSRSYDLVLDGAEIGGGSIRNHRADVQQRIFEIIVIAPD